MSGVQIPLPLPYLRRLKEGEPNKARLLELLGFFAGRRKAKKKPCATRGLLSEPQRAGRPNKSLKQMKTKALKIKNWTLGGDEFHVWAGPCAIESEKRFLKIAKFVQERGGSGLRGGIFKLRTDPKDFQGLGEKALEIAKKAKSQTKLLFVSEITDPRQIELLEPVLDIYQVGARNMFNYELLKELGKSRKPVLLKRSFSARIQEWLKAAGYLAQGGNENIILCERGIRTFETQTRNTLDLNSVAFLKQESHFPRFC